MKTAIVYYSKHHGNTKKLLDAIAARHEVSLIDALEPSGANLDEFDLIGFASGIYYSKFHKSVLRFAADHLPNGKKFSFFTPTAQKRRATPTLSQALSSERTLIFWVNTAATALTPSAPSS